METAASRLTEPYVTYVVHSRTSGRVAASINFMGEWKFFMVEETPGTPLVAATVVAAAEATDKQRQPNREHYRIKPPFAVRINKFAF